MTRLTSLTLGLLAFALAKGCLAQDGSIEQGRQAFDRYCVYCHGAGPGDDGAPMLPGTHAIQLKYRGEKPALLWQRDDLSLPFMLSVVRNGLASMPPFRQTEVTDEDLAAILKYFESRSREETP